MALDPKTLLASRLAAYYGALFLSVGVYVPFWPLWLAGRGLPAEDIGLILALATWVRVLTTPAISHIADRRGQVRPVLFALALATAMVFAVLDFAQGFWVILLLNVLGAAAFQAIMPLTESQTMAIALREGMDYGRIRLWGSLTFILGTVGAGRLLTGRDADLVLYLIVTTLLVMLLGTFILPREQRPATTAVAPRMRVLLAERRFLLFFGAAACLQASHAAYYAFSALHWRAAGLSEATIGWLWAEGVIAEVLLFAFSGAAVARAGPLGLLFAGAAGGIVRWLVLGETTALPALIAVQALHAATFGAAHLGAMHYLTRNAPPGLAISAQGVYSAIVGGLATGLVLLLSGRLYEAFGGGAFSAMAVFSAGGGALTVVLARAAKSTPPRSPRPE